MINRKKLFSTIAAVAVGTVAGTGLLMKPVVALADHHEGTTHEEKKCSGDKKGHEDDGDENGCSGENGCAGEEGHDEGK